jgi:hypothetical protein
MDSSLDTPDIKETRLLLRAKAVLERHGLDDTSCSEAISRLRQATVDDIGMHDYLHKILMGKGNWPANQFTLYYRCTEYVPEEEDGIVDVLMRRIEEHGLPEKVEVEEGGQPQTYYL